MKFIIDEEVITWERYEIEAPTAQEAMMRVRTSELSDEELEGREQLDFVDNGKIEAHIRDQNNELKMVGELAR